VTFRVGEDRKQEEPEKVRENLMLAMFHLIGDLKLKIGLSYFELYHDLFLVVLPVGQSVSGQRLLSSLK
jgi:hypothetical protein